jgi:hypothetical protein
MKLKASISVFFRYAFVAICFVAISLNALSFQGGNLTKAQEQKKEHKQDDKDSKEDYKFCAYEAVVPTVHFNVVYHFNFIIDVRTIETPVQIIKQSAPLFTRPYYRTLFRMIISPNAP